MEHVAIQTLPTYLGVGRAHTATHRVSEDLIYLESLDADTEERLIITWLSRVYVGKGQTIALHTAGC